MRRLFVAVALSGLLLAVGRDATGQSSKQFEQVQGLIKTLKTSKDAKARAAAAKELLEIGQVKLALVRPAELSLIDCLKDDNAEVRGAAVVALIIFEPYKKN